MNKWGAWLRGSRSLAIGVFLLGSTPVLAQESEPDPAIIESDAQESAAQPERAHSLDEVIVTAQKREQRLQDVPLSIQVIGAEEIRDRGMDSLNEMGFFVPSFSLGVADGGIGGSISMRGLTSSNNRGMEPGVALVIDDIYYGRIEYTVDNFLDMAQIEILRGPQGTLFGKNSVTGAIVLRTKEPHFDGWEFDGQITGLITEEGASGTVIANAPILEDRIAARFAWRAHYASLPEQVNTTEPVESYQRKNVGRAKLRIDLTDAIETVLQVDYVKSNTVGAFTQQAAASPLFLAVNRLFDPEFETNDRDQKTSIDRTPRLYKESLTYNAQLGWDVGANWSLQYTGGFSEFDQGTDGDIDFMPMPFLTTQADDTFTQTSHEIRLISPADLWNGRLSFVAGAYYFWSHFDGINRIGALEVDNFGGLLTDLLSPPLVTGLLDALGITALLNFPFSQDGSTMFFDQYTRSAALYGQTEIDLLQNLKLTAGLRLNYEAKQIAMERAFDQTGLIFMIMTGQQAFAADLNRSEFSALPRLSLSYNATDDIMVFATYGQGVKSGGYNANAGTAQEAEFEQETSVTYEIGVKSEFFGGALRLNGTAYWTEIDDFQFSQFNGLEFVVENAGSVRAVGFEADGFLLLPFGMAVLGSFGYTDSQYTSFPNGPCRAGTEGPCDLTDEVLAGAPRLSGSAGVNYLNQLGNLPFDLLLGFDAGFRSSAFLDADLDPMTRQGGYTLYNGWVELRADDESWRINFRAENLTDKFYRTSAFDTPVATGGYTTIPGAGRSMNLSARFLF